MLTYYILYYYDYYYVGTRYTKPETQPSKTKTEINRKPIN